MKKYKKGYKLKYNEYLCKIAEDGIGFITKYNKDGSVPKSFDTWRETYHNKKKLPTFIHSEDFKQGWEVVGYRTGKSQDWAEVKNPAGFILEIYLKNFFDIIEDVSVINKVFQHNLKWENKRLCVENPITVELISRWDEDEDWRVNETKEFIKLETAESFCKKYNKKWEKYNNDPDRGYKYSSRIKK